MEDDVVKREHARQAQGEVEHARVVPVVPHLVERQPAARAGLGGRSHGPAPLDLGIERQVRQADQADVRDRREVRQEVDAVVGDAGADGGEWGDVVEVHGLTPWPPGPSPLAPLPPHSPQPGEGNADVAICT